MLVVDDNPEMNAFEAEVLGRRYRVVTALDGEAGLRSALENRPDLIVSDVMMPRISGDQMVRELRRYPEMEDTPIIMVTARAGEDFLVKMLKEGAQGYLIKPFSVEELMARAEGLITEKLLKQALRRSNSELQEFAYAVSHDLREPLRTISSFLELLSRRYSGKLDRKADEFIYHAVDGASRMDAMIGDLLEYSRVQRQEMDLQPVDLSEVLVQTKEQLASMIEQVDAHVTHGPLSVVRGSRTQLKRLLQNLIGNAIKYRRPEIKPEVHISAAPHGAQWLVSVRDNGIGIPSDQQERIFQVFQRLHSREEYPGTGVGLAICKKIVERHGGRIWVESEPGKGSTFFITLPKA